MVNMIGVVVVSFIVFGLGGGLGYLIWLKTRPQKQTWFANVYQLADGVREIVHADKSVLSLKNMKPYAKDVLEKVERGKGITIYRLQRLNMITPAVEEDVVDFWGENKREVHVLKRKSGCTLLKKGYDVEKGEEIFDPLPQSRVNLIKSEIINRQSRYQNEKDILQAITPWVVTGIAFIGLLMIVYLVMDGMVDISDGLGTKLDIMSERGLKIAKLNAGVSVAELNSDGDGEGDEFDTSGNAPFVE